MMSSNSITSPFLLFSNAEIIETDFQVIPLYNSFSIKEIEKLLQRHFPLLTICLTWCLMLSSSFFHIDDNPRNTNVNRVVWRVKMPSLLLYSGWRRENLDTNFPALKPEVSVEGYIPHWKLSINGTRRRLWILHTTVEYLTLTSLLMGKIIQLLFYGVSKEHEQMNKRLYLYTAMYIRITCSILSILILSLFFSLSLM